MTTPPTFGSAREQVSRTGDAEFWQPFVAEVLARHGLADTAHPPVAGYNATYPTFVCGDVVVKLFGGPLSWRSGHAAESAALTLVATEPEVGAPKLLAEGRLFDDDDSWPYLVTSRVPGVASHAAGLSSAQRLLLAADLGRRVRRLHAMRPEGVATDAYWSGPSVKAAAARSSLPAHLVAQAGDYVARLGAYDLVFTHADLCAAHAFVEGGRLSGLIDWGDAMVTDRHFELIQVHRDAFGCDKGLLRAFLDASDWPVGPDFARLALGHALRRQAVGLAQHRGMDVYEPVAALIPLREIGTLAELADALFGV